MDGEAAALRELLAVASRQDAVVTSRDLAAVGLPVAYPRRRVRRGDWTPLLRGAHLVQPGRTGDRRTRSWARAASLVVPGAVVALGTAATLHGISGAPALDSAQVLLPHALAKRGRPGLEVHEARLGPDDVVDLGGLLATSCVRTLADLVPRLARPDALAVLDSALATGAVDAAGIAAARDLVAGRRGCRAVADLWALADGRAESPLESRARLRCVDAGVPPDDLQVVIRDDHGEVVARADLVFRRRRRPGRGLLVLEADGRDVHAAPDALYRDRGRANALVALGHDVIRCTWADTLRPHRVPAMVLAAL